MPTDEQDRLDKRVFDFIVSRGVSWVFGSDIAEHFDGEGSGWALGRLVKEGLIERWEKCPKGPAWALTPYAAARLGFELDKTSRTWVRGDQKKKPIRVKINSSLSNHESRTVLIGKSSLYSIEIRRPASRRTGANLTSFESEVGNFDEMFVGGADDPADFLAAYEEIVGEPESIEPGDAAKNQHSNKDYSDRPIPPPRVFIGTDESWPVGGQRREHGPAEGQPRRSDECEACKGEIEQGGIPTCCLCCGAFSHDFMIPTIELFRDGRLLWEAIKQRKRRKAARAEARRVKRPVGRPRKHPKEGA